MEPDIFSAGGNLARDLAAANEFSADELAANQASRIAAPQRRRLYGVWAIAAGKSLFVFVAWLLFAFALAPRLVGNMFGRPKHLSTDSLLAILAILSFFACLYALLDTLWLVIDLGADLLHGRAEMVEGRVSASSTTDIRIVHESPYCSRDSYEVIKDSWAYAIGDELLPVSLAAFRALQPYSGSSFRVYLTPRSRLLLSLEPTKIRRPDRLVR